MKKGVDVKYIEWRVCVVFYSRSIDLISDTLFRNDVKMLLSAEEIVRVDSKRVYIDKMVERKQMALDAVTIMDFLKYNSKSVSEIIN